MKDQRGLGARSALWLRREMCACMWFARKDPRATADPACTRCRVSRPSHPRESRRRSFMCATLHCSRLPLLAAAAACPASRGRASIVQRFRCSVRIHMYSYCLSEARQRMQPPTTSGCSILAELPISMITVATTTCAGHPGCLSLAMGNPIFSLATPLRMRMPCSISNNPRSGRLRPCGAQLCTRPSAGP